MQGLELDNLYCEDCQAYYLLHESSKESGIVNILLFERATAGFNYFSKTQFLAIYYYDIVHQLTADDTNAI